MQQSDLLKPFLVLESDPHKSLIDNDCDNENMSLEFFDGSCDGRCSWSCLQPADIVTTIQGYLTAINFDRTLNLHITYNLLILDYAFSFWQHSTAFASTCITTDPNELVTTHHDRQHGLRRSKKAFYEESPEDSL